MKKRGRKKKLKYRPMFRLPTPENTDDCIEDNLADTLLNYYIVERKRKNWKR